MLPDRVKVGPPMWPRSLSHNHRSGVRSLRDLGVSELAPTSAAPEQNPAWGRLAVRSGVARRGAGQGVRRVATCVV